MSVRTFLSPLPPKNTSIVNSKSMNSPQADNLFSDLLRANESDTICQEKENKERY